MASLRVSSACGQDLSSDVCSIMPVRLRPTSLWDMTDESLGVCSKNGKNFDTSALTVAHIYYFTV